jgi:hypothetical protein
MTFCGNPLSRLLLGADMTVSDLTLRGDRNRRLIATIVFCEIQNSCRAHNKRNHLLSLANGIFKRDVMPDFSVTGDCSFAIKNPVVLGS